MLVQLILILISQAVSALISWDTSCGVSKGCFPDCPGGCDYLVTWSQSGQTVQFTIQAEETDTNVYLAIGFSDDYRMGDDSVVGCMVEANTVVSAYNDGLHTELLNPTNLGLSSGGATVSQSNGVITCSFTRDLTNSNDKFHDLNDDYILMLVIGEAKGSKPGKHYVIPWNSDGKVDFNSNEIVDVFKLNSPIVKLHGVVSVLAWLLCSIVGILTARYNKQMLQHKTLLGSKVWFQVHRASMIAVLVLVLIGIVPLFAHIGGYSQICPAEGQSFLKAHPILGIIVIVFTIANPILGLLRPAMDHKYRWLFNIIHMILGIGTQVIAVASVFLGYNLERASLPDSSNYVTLASIVIVTIATVVMEIHKWKHGKERRGSAVGNESTHKDDGVADMNMEEKHKDKPPPTSVLPFYILLAVAVVVFGHSIGSIGIIAAS